MARSVASLHSRRVTKRNRFPYFCSLTDGRFPTLRRPQSDEKASPITGIMCGLGGRLRRETFEGCPVSGVGGLDPSSYEGAVPGGEASRFDHVLDRDLLKAGKDLCREDFRPGLLVFCIPFCHGRLVCSVGFASLGCGWSAVGGVDARGSQIGEMVEPVLASLGVPADVTELSPFSGVGATCEAVGSDD